MDDLFEFASRAERREPARPVPAAPPKSEHTVLTVAEVTRAVREAIESGVGEVWVEGEISNHRRQSSGHHYFVLKDDTAQLQCVLFARAAAGVARHMQIADGRQVQCHGRMSVYEARGQYQLVVTAMRHAGDGTLLARFEALKRRLEAEGLFEPARRKPIPAFPKTVLLVTSPTGAAVRDMIHVFHRRAPFIQLIVWPVRVQGVGAAEEIAAAIRGANTASGTGMPAIDVMIAGRGGGSIEDLWAFNEEVVARAIAESSIPVISAVGHETDFTIADFVADLRAPTPSAAAEVASPDGTALRSELAGAAAAIHRLAMQGIDRGRATVTGLRRAALFSEPERRIASARQHLDHLESAVSDGVVREFAAARQRVVHAAVRLKAMDPAERMRSARERLAALHRRLPAATGTRLRTARLALERQTAMLRLLSPQATLDRGYALITLADGTVLKHTTAAVPGTRITARVADGTFDATVTQ